MPSWAYLIIAIALIAVLLVIFVVSFVIYRRTPVPKGCEKLPNPTNCAACSNPLCKENVYKKDDKKEK